MAASTATITRIAASASAVTLLAAKGPRLPGTAIVNESSATLYIKYGPAALTTDYTYQIPLNQTWEMPFAYTGIITGIWSSATGFAQITELTS